MERVVDTGVGETEVEGSNPITTSVGGWTTGEIAASVIVGLMVLYVIIVGIIPEFTKGGGSTASDQKTSGANDYPKIFKFRGEMSEKQAHVVLDKTFDGSIQFTSGGAVALLQGTYPKWTASIEGAQFTVEIQNNTVLRMVNPDNEEMLGDKVDFDPAIEANLLGSYTIPGGATLTFSKSSMGMSVNIDHLNMSASSNAYRVGPNLWYYRIDKETFVSVIDRNTLKILEGANGIVLNRITQSGMAGGKPHPIQLAVSMPY